MKRIKLLSGIAMTLLLSGCEGPPPQNETNHVILLAPVLAAPCTHALENLRLAEKAARENDEAGMGALLADGRVFEMTTGTRLDVSGHNEMNEDTISEVYVESGALIGKTVCMDKRTLRANSNPIK